MKIVYSSARLAKNRKLFHRTSATSKASNAATEWKINQNDEWEQYNDHHACSNEKNGGEGEKDENQYNDLDIKCHQKYTAYEKRDSKWNIIEKNCFYRRTGWRYWVLSESE